jgi:hypothetical protein
MSITATTRPDDDEHIPYFGQYIALVPDGDIIDVLEGQIETTIACLREMPLEAAQSRPAPGEWNPAEIVGHLIDTERVLDYRALRIARADATMWESIDFEAYVEHARIDIRSMASLLDEFVAVRAATIAFLRGLDQTAWNRRMPDEWSCRTVRSLAYVVAGHELHHLADLRQML